MMKKDKILVYGAAGYMGKVWTKLAAKHDLPLVLSARNPFPAAFPTRIFSLNEQDVIERHLQDVQLLINLAGPFHHTNRPLVEACIKSRTHYMDIAGEVPEFETVLQYHDAAVQAGVMLLPGAGFGVVPTDIVANVAKQKLPDATRIKIAYHTQGGASRGTLKTVLKDIHKTGVILKNGQFEAAAPASKTFSFQVEGKKLDLVYNPWRADLLTAYRSTGIRNIETYANFPGFVVKMMQGKYLWLRDFMLNNLLSFLPEGPSEKQLQQGRTICHAEVENEKGERASATLIGPEAYLFTAEAVLVIARSVLQNRYVPGFQTPNIYQEALLGGIPNLKLST
jgi:short subunit dehydrogenase-like uncharacterized protein